MRAVEHWVGQRLSLLGAKRRAAYREVVALARPYERGRPVAAFDLQSVRLDRDRGRDAHRLITLFRESGHAIGLVDRYPFVSSFGRQQYKRLIVQHPFTIVPEVAALAEGSLLITDRSAPAPSGVRRLHVDYSRKFSPDPTRVAVPYGPHPVVAEQGRAEFGERHWRLFFAGNDRPGKYDREQGGRLSRVEMLDTVRETLPADRQLRIADESTLESDAPFRGFAHVDFSSLYVPETRWLRTLGRAEFFLACPGVRMPMCHNVIEALSVGAVPLLEYPEAFHPSLEDGINALVFSGREDLRRKLERLLEIDESEIARLRSGALDYYERHLTAQAFGKALDAAAEPVTLYPYAHLTAC